MDVSENNYGNENRLISKEMSNIYLGAVRMRWTGPARGDGSPKWDDFYPTFIWNFLSRVKKFVVSLEKDCFDLVVLSGSFLFSM